MEPTGWFTLTVAPSLNGSSSSCALARATLRGQSAVSGDGWNGVDDAEERLDAVSAGEIGRGMFAGDSIGGAQSDVAVADSRVGRIPIPLGTLFTHPHLIYTSTPHSHPRFSSPFPPATQPRRLHAHAPTPKREPQGPFQPVLHRRRRPPPPLVLPADPRDPQVSYTAHQPRGDPACAGTLRLAPAQPQLCLLFAPLPAAFSGLPVLIHSRLRMGRRCKSGAARVSDPAEHRDYPRAGPAIRRARASDHGPWTCHLARPRCEQCGRRRRLDTGTNAEGRKRQNVCKAYRTRRGRVESRSEIATRVLWVRPPARPFPKGVSNKCANRMPCNKKEARPDILPRHLSPKLSPIIV